MPLIQLCHSDGSYNRMKDAWRAQCEAVEEDFSQYARGTFIVFDELASQPERRAGIFAVQKGAAPETICQVNCTPLPGHPEPVLRVRMVTMAPDLDFGVVNEDVYIDSLIEMFFGIVDMSQSHDDEGFRAEEIKFHLRSPQDFDFFRAVRATLSKYSGFKSVEMKGAWLYITRTA